MTHVLRMQIGDACILFDRSLHASVEIVSIEKKRAIVLIRSIDQNPCNTTQITVLLPLLKKESFELALYSLVEAGVDAIQLVTTEKSQGKYTEHESIRAEKILIAAAEQSKHFRFPELTKPEPLHKIVGMFADPHCKKVCAHPEGKSFFDFAQAATTSQEYVLIVGPEADFSADELTLLQKHSFEFVSLTPTILRSFQAVFLLAGAVRSLTHQKS